MALIHIPAGADHEGVLNALVQGGAFRAETRHFTVRLAGGALSAGALAYLTTWGRLVQRRGAYLTIDGERGALSQLNRMGVYRTLELASHGSHGSYDMTLVLPVRLLESGDDVFHTTSAVLELVAREFEHAHAFLPALEWAVNETIDNIQLHAEAPVAGAVCAFYNKSAGLLDIGIADVGQGLLASLSPVLEPWESHGDAIAKAVQRGVTRDLSVGQGNGLAGALEITERNRGTFTLWSGDNVFRVRGGRDKGFLRLKGPVPGVGVSFLLDPKRPVALSETFISAPAYTFLEAEADRLADSGGLHVRSAVSNTGTRATGRQLRNKVLNLLRATEDSVTVDFAGTERASSSFLDEFLGRLAHTLGAQQFHARLRIVNLSPQLRSMTNVVITQRLEQEQRL